MKIILKQIIIIIILSITLGLFRNYFIEDNSVLFFKYKNTVDKVNDFIIPDLMTAPKEVETDFTKYYFDSGEAVIIDARDQDQYSEDHIKGSINIPYNYYDEFFNQLEELPKDDIYIVYCNGGECSLSLDLAYTMYDEFDFENVFVYEEGLPVWKKNKYPIELGNSNNISEKQITTTSKSSERLLQLLQLSMIAFYGIFLFRIINDKNKSLRLRFKTMAIVSFRLLVGGIFIWASIQKIVDPLEFSKQIDLYKATPIIINNIIALIIPWIELLIGFGLILNRNIKGSIILSIVLFILFILLLSQAYYRGFTLDCGCFGNTTNLLSDSELQFKMLKRIYEDIIFLSMSIYLYFIYIINKSKNEN